MNYILEKKFSLKDNNVQIGLAFTIIGIVMSLGLMHGDSTLSTPDMRRTLAVPNYLCTLFLLVKIAQFHEIKNVTIGLLCSIFVYWIIYSFHSYNGEIVSPLSLVPAVLFFLSQPDAKFYAFKFFRLYLIVISILGIIAYLSFLLSLPIPYQMVDYYSNRFEAFYVDFKFSYIVLQDITPRLAGLFAEPGEMGVFIAMYLIADKYNFKKIGNIIMFMAALCTLSLAFWIISLFYFLVTVIQDKKKIILLIVFVVIGMIALPRLAEGNEVIALFLERFSPEKNKGFTRVTGDFDILYDKMFERGEWLWGYGSGFLRGKDLAASGYKPIIIQHGVMGMIIIYGLFFLIVFKSVYKKSQLLVFLIMYFLVFYNYGMVYSLYYLILLLGGFEYIKQLTYSQKLITTKTNKETKIVKKYGYSI